MPAPPSLQIVSSRVSLLKLSPTYYQAVTLRLPVDPLPSWGQPPAVTLGLGSIWVQPLGVQGPSPLMDISGQSSSQRLGVMIGLPSSELERARCTTTTEHRSSNPSHRAQTPNLTTPNAEHSVRAPAFHPKITEHCVRAPAISL